MSDERISCRNENGNEPEPCRMQGDSMDHVKAYSLRDEIPPPGAEFPGSMKRDQSFSLAFDGVTEFANLSPGDDHIGEDTQGSMSMWSTLPSYSCRDCVRMPIACGVEPANDTCHHHERAPDPAMSISGNTDFVNIDGVLDKVDDDLTRYADLVPLPPWWVRLWRWPRAVWAPIWGVETYPKTLTPEEIKTHAYHSRHTRPRFHGFVQWLSRNPPI